MMTEFSSLFGACQQTEPTSFTFIVHSVRHRCTIAIWLIKGIPGLNRLWRFNLIFAYRCCMSISKWEESESNKLGYIAQLDVAPEPEGPV